MKPTKAESLHQEFIAIQEHYIDRLFQCVDEILGHGEVFNAFIRLQIAKQQFQQIQAQLPIFTPHEFRLKERLNEMNHIDTNMVLEMCRSLNGADPEGALRKALRHAA